MTQVFTLSKFRLAFIGLFLLPQAALGYSFCSDIFAIEKLDPALISVSHRNNAGEVSSIFTPEGLGGGRIEQVGSIIAWETGKPLGGKLRFTFSIPESGNRRDKVKVDTLGVVSRSREGAIESAEVQVERTAQIGWVTENHYRVQIVDGKPVRVLTYFSFETGEGSFYFRGEIPALKEQGVAITDASINWSTFNSKTFTVITSDGKKIVYRLIRKDSFEYIMQHLGVVSEASRNEIENSAATMEEI